MRDLTAIPMFLQHVKEMAVKKGRLIIALDGRCASGKSKLARQLQLDYGWDVVHLDHFFLRPEQRSAVRLDMPGENVDHERFLMEVLEPLRAGKTAEYRPFNCATGKLDPPIRVEPGPVVLVEGSYACHPALWDHYDLRVFMTVEPETQMRRILERDGEEKAKIYRETWIPLEESYFKALDIESRCDYRLES